MPKRHRIKPLCVVLALGVALGVVTTLATAWGADVVRGVRAARKPGSQIEWWDSARSLRVVDQRNRFAGTWKHSFWVDETSLDNTPYEVTVAPGPDVVGAKDLPDWAAWAPAKFSDGFVPPHGLDASTHATGLPWRCARTVIFNGGHDGYFAYETHGAWRPGKLVENALPMLPIGPGLAGDLAVWTAAWIGALLLLAAVRRRFRRRGDRCASCGYSRRGLPATAVCPECGNAA